MAIAVYHGDTAGMLAGWVTDADGPYTVISTDEFESIDGDVVCALEVETGLPSGRAAGHHHSEGFIVIALTEENDWRIVGATVVFRELEAAPITAPREYNAVARLGGGDGVSYRRRSITRRARSTTLGTDEYFL